MPETRAELLARLAAAGATPTLVRDQASTRIEVLRGFVAAYERTPRARSLRDVALADAEAMADARRGVEPSPQIPVTAG